MTAMAQKLLDNFNSLSESDKNEFFQTLLYQMHNIGTEELTDDAYCEIANAMIEEADKAPGIR